MVPSPRRGLVGAALLAAESRRSVPVVDPHPHRHPAARSPRTGGARVALRGRRLRHVGRGAAADRVRVGARGARHPGAGRLPRRAGPGVHVSPHRSRPVHRSDGPWRSAADLRRLLGVDLLGVPAVPRLPAGRGGDRRIQRQVHVRPAGAARRRCAHATRATSARPIATSSIRTRAGISPASDSPAMPKRTADPPG